MVCGAVIYPEDTHITGEHSIVLTDGSHYATFDLTIIHYTLNNWEEFENSSIYEGLFEDEPVFGIGFAGSQFYLDIPRESIGIIGTRYVSLDGTCDIIGEGVDEPYFEKVAIIGPFTDEEEGSTVCAYVVYATEHCWTGDEFEVTLVDGIEENNLNMQVTIVSEDNTDWDDDDDYDGDDDDEDDDDYYDNPDEEGNFEIWSNEDEARQSEGWTYLSELIEVVEFDGGNRETLDIEIMIAGANYIKLSGVDRNFECATEGWAPVYGIAGPYLDDSGEWACGVFIYADVEELDLGEEFLFYITSGEDWMTVIVTMTYATVSTPESAYEL